MDPYKVAMSKLVLAISQLEAVSSNLVTFTNLDSSITSLPDPPESEIKLVLKDGFAVLDETVSYLYEVNSFFSKFETAKNDSCLTVDEVEQPENYKCINWKGFREDPKEVKIDAIKTTESDCMTPNEIFEYAKNNDVKLSVIENYKFIHWDSPEGIFIEKLKISLKKRKHYIIKRLIVDETIALIMQHPSLFKSYYMNHEDDYFKGYKIFSPHTDISVANWYILKMLLGVVINSEDPIYLTTDGILEAFRGHPGVHVLVDQSQYCIDTADFGEGSLSDDIVTRINLNLKFLEKFCHVLVDKRDKRKGQRLVKRTSAHSKKYCSPRHVPEFLPDLSKWFIYTNLYKKPSPEGFMDCLVRVGKRWKVNIQKLTEWVEDNPLV